MRSTRLLWVLLFVMFALLVWGAHAAFAQDILNPPTSVYKLAWDHDGLNTDHYDIRVNTTAPWINVGKPMPLQVAVPELAVGTYMADVRACNDKTKECATSAKAAAFNVVPVTLPAIWSHKDIGLVGVLGSVSWVNGTFTVLGDGLDIWGKTDAFQFVSQPLGDNNEIIARVTKLPNTNINAKAGVMMRGSLDPGSQHVMINTATDGSIEFISRGNAKDISSVVTVAVQPRPVWLKLTRVGNHVNGSMSVDGKVWVLVGAVDVLNLNLAGLIVTSADTTLGNASTFDNVSVDVAAIVPLAPLNVRGF